LIVFKKVRWKNLLSTGDEWTEISLTANNTTLVIGDNGSGKSTVLDALTYALFNKPFRKINKPQLVNTINAKKLLVEVEFTIGTNEYMVRRGMRPGIFEIHKNGVILPQDAKIGDHQYVLEKTILKLNYKSFTQIVVLGNSSFVPFMQLPAASRREVIEDLLDIQIFSLMNGLLKGKMSTNKEDIMLSTNQLGLVEDRIGIQENYIETLRSDNATAIANIEYEIRLSQDTIGAHHITIAALDTKTKQLLARINDEGKNKAAIAELHTIQDQISRNARVHKKAIKFLEDNEECPSCQQYIDDEFRSSRIAEKSTKLEELLAGLEKLESKLTTMEARQEKIFAVNQEVAQYNQNISAENTAITGLNAYIAKLNGDIVELRKVKDDHMEEAKKLEEHQKALVMLTEKREELVNLKAIYDMAATLLKDGGVKTRIIRQYVPIMNKLVNKYLAALDFFVGFELDEKFNEVIRSRNRDEFSYASFSEGEKTRLDLALLMTWRAIAKMKNSVATNLLILDEVFDSSLDPAGCEDFMKLLYDLSSADNANIFIISHKGETLQDKFDETIVFEKHKSFSRMAVL